MTLQPRVKCFACLSQSHFGEDGLWNAQMRRDPAMKRHNNSAKEACDYKESWHTHVRKHTDALPVYRSPSCSGTVGVSKWQRSIWIAVATTLKAGRPRDARLTLLTCLYQHARTASMAEWQFSHGSSQNKVFTHFALARKLLSSTHNAYLLYSHT